MAERAWLKPYQFKKGQSGNYGGRPKSAFKRVSDDVWSRFVDELTNGGPGALERLYNSPDRTDFEKTVIELWTSVGRDGNVQAFIGILDRIMGKQHTRVEVQPVTEKVNMVELSDDELSRRAALLDEAE